MLLTSGRLGEKNKALVRSAILPYFSSGDIDRATRIAQQLLVSSPEYHTTGVPRRIESVRQAEAYDDLPSQPYKALVVFVMNGGCGKCFHYIFQIVASPYIHTNVIKFIPLQTPSTF